jgi:DNA-binding transcriptional LysR family regulator
MSDQRVSEFERVLCATPAYMARKGVPDSPRSLPQHDCLSHATNETRIWFFLRGRTLLAQAIEPRIEVDNYSVLLELARRSLGIARVAHNLVKKDLASDRLVRVLPGYKCVYPDGELPGLWVLYPNRRVLHRTRLLIDFLTTNLRGAR